MMSTIRPISFYGGASQPKARFNPTKTATRFGGFESVPAPRLKLQTLVNAGLPDESSRKLIIQLAQTGDYPYHVGKLLNGNIFLVTNQDRVFFGKPEQFKELKVVEQARTKCFNQQKRFLETDNGLRITLESKNGIQSAVQVSELFAGPFWIPKPVVR